MMVIYLLLRDIFLGHFQKRTKPHPKRKFLPSREGEGNHIKDVLNLCRMSIKGKGKLLISSMREMDIFWSNPFCGNIRKKILSRNKIPCIFNITVAIKIYQLNFFVGLNNCNVEIVLYVSAAVIGLFC